MIDSEHEPEIYHLIERVSKAEQENVALKAQIQDWRLPAKDRHCPFCTHPDYVTRGHAHFHKGVIDHAGVVCTDYVGFVAQRLFEAKVENVALRAKLASWRPR